jgi:flagellar capping protein FliD
MSDIDILIEKERKFSSKLENIKGRNQSAKEALAEEGIKTGKELQVKINGIEKELEDLSKQIELTNNEIEKLEEELEKEFENVS